jgi:hypothetical protein
MRFPDREVGEQIVTRALELGIRYFDTAPGYKLDKDTGECSELWTGGAFAAWGRREDYYVSAKTRGDARGHVADMTDDAPTGERIRGFLEQSLRRLRVGYFDFYHLWFMNDLAAWEKAKEPGGALDVLSRYKQAGLIRHLGITTHAKPDEAIAVLRTGIFDIVTVSYNFVNREMEPVIDEAGRLGIAVVVMNPIGGGLLACAAEEALRRLPGSPKSLAEVSLRYVVSHPHVTTAIAGFSSVDELEADFAMLSDKPLFSAAEREEVHRVMSDVRSSLDVACTTCGYCLPCTKNLGIPRIFQTYQLWRGFGIERAREQFNRGYGRKGGAYDVDLCTQCRECVPRCSQGIDIPVALRTVRDAMFVPPPPTPQ